MARVVIADAGPLIALAFVDELELLRALFGQVQVTTSVLNECLAKPGSDARRIEAAIGAGWLMVEAGEAGQASLSPSLGLGESDSIRLGLRTPEEALLIMDDRLARRYALKRGLPVVGTARLLDIAERKGHVESAEQCISAMADRGYRISLDLLKKMRLE